MEFQAAETAAFFVSGEVVGLDTGLSGGGGCESCAGVLDSLHQAGSQVTVDIDQNADFFRLRVCQDFKRSLENEDTQRSDVVFNVLRERVVFVDGLSGEKYPKLAVVLKCVADFFARYSFATVKTGGKRF